MNLSWRRIENCAHSEEEGEDDELILPQIEPGWSLLDSEASTMLNEVSNYTKLARTAKRLTFQQGFRLRRIIECLAVCGFEFELLQTWKSELVVICQSFADDFYRNHQIKSVDDLAFAATDYLEAVESLAEAGVPLDFLYTCKTPHKNTKGICFEAFKSFLNKPAEDDRLDSALNQLVRSIWLKMIERESQILTQPLMNMLKSLSDPTMIKQIQILSKLLHSLDAVSSELLSDGVNIIIEVIFRDFKNPALTDQSTIVSKLLAASEQTFARLRTVYVGHRYKTLKSLFATRVRSKLFEQEELDSGNLGVWLNQEFQRRQVIDLNGIWKPIIETHTTFEWIFLHDGDNWRALNTLAKESDAYTNNVLSAWSKFLARTCSELIADHSAVTSVQLISALLVWIVRLTSQAESLFGAQAAKHAREALVSAFNNRTIVSEALTEYVEYLWATGAEDTDYQKIMIVFRALSNKALTQTLLETALLRTLLVKNTPPSHCVTFINLLQAECGENYVLNMKSALNEFTEDKTLSAQDVRDQSTDHDPTSILSVKVISARLYNSQSAPDRKVIPSATCIALPCWGLPSLIHEEFRRYIDTYKVKHSHRLLTFAMEVSSATIQDLRTENIFEVSASQFLLLNLFNSQEVISAERVEELYRDGQGALVISSLKPLIELREDESVGLTEVCQSIVDYRSQWLTRWSGSDHTATGANSPVQAAIRASVTLFYDVGLDALIMRTLKQKACEFRLLKTAIDLYAAERFGNHIVPETTIKKHLERLSARDFISIDQSIISLIH